MKHVHIYCSRTICALPPALNLVVSLPFNLPSSQRRATHMESNSTTGKQMGKKEQKHSPKLLEPEQIRGHIPKAASPRVQGEEKAQGTLLLDHKWSHGHLEPQMPQLQKSRTWKEPDLNWRNGAAFHAATCEIPQVFPKVTQDTSTETPRAAPAVYCTDPETKGWLLPHSVFMIRCNKSSAEIQGYRDL